MTPQERQLVYDLFDRLERLESAPRDAEAERVIRDGLVRAPNAVYALVQTALVQDEALKRADARIRELSGEGEPPQQQSSGFLDTVREALTGGGRTSVPSVNAGAAGGPDPRWNQGGTYQSAPNYQSGPQGYAPGYAPSGGFGMGGGSFLGTAAASAAGYIGGALLLNSISSMFGHHGSAFASAYDPATASGSPSDNSAASSDLAREAGLNDVGGDRRANDAQPAGLFDADDTDDSGDFDGDFGDDSGGDFGGSDDA
jgi:hypothetical protein